jgi:hypothetical protein
MRFSSQQMMQPLQGNMGSAQPPVNDFQFPKGLVYHFTCASEIVHHLDLLRTVIEPAHP